MNGGVVINFDEFANFYQTNRFIIWGVLALIGFFGFQWVSKKLQIINTIFSWLTFFISKMDKIALSRVGSMTVLTVGGFMIGFGAIEQENHNNVLKPPTPPTAETIQADINRLARGNEFVSLNTTSELNMELVKMRQREYEDLKERYEQKAASECECDKAILLPQYSAGILGSGVCLAGTGLLLLLSGLRRATNT